MKKTLSFKASVKVADESQAIELINKLKELGLVFERDRAYVTDNETLGIENLSTEPVPMLKGQSLDKI